MLLSFVFGLLTQIHMVGAQGTVVKVMPEFIEYDPINIVGKEFMIAIVVENVNALCGIDFKFCWNTSYIDCVNCTASLGVDTKYPNPISPSPYAGILHEPVWITKNEVNATAGTYWLSAASFGAPSFNGSGTAFVMAFRVTDQPSSGEEDVVLNLYLTSTDLVNTSVKFIPHVTLNGTLIIHPVDIIPPAIFLLSPDNSTYDTNDVALTFVVNESTSWIGYSMDCQGNVTISGNITMSLSDGPHVIVVYANDSVGNIGYSGTVYFTIDTMSPKIDVLSPKNRVYADNEVLLSFIVSELTSWIGYSLDGGINVSISGNNLITGLSEGPHNLVVYANDTFGNMGSSDTIYFAIDTVAPIISVISPENKTYATNSVALTFTLSEPAAWIGYTLDGQANITIVGNITIFNLSEGVHSIVCYANDTVENIGYSEIVYFTIETQQELTPIWIATIVIGGAIGVTLLVFFISGVKKAGEKFYKNSSTRVFRDCIFHRNFLQQ